MSQANQMVCWGNLTRDPELRYFENGSAVCNTGMAINKTWTDPQGKKQESTEFFDLSVCCLLYTSPSPRDLSTSRMPSSA